MERSFNCNLGIIKPFVLKTLTSYNPNKLLKMKQLILSLLVLTLFSCKKNEEKSGSEISNRKVQDTLQTERENDEIEKQDTLKINYTEHKNLLDILTVLPDSSMGSWEWNKIDRVQYVKKTQKNNYALPLRDRFSKISLTQPNTLEIQVVDGNWILSIYKVKPNNYIVITDDIVGDGNQLMAFEYLNGTLTYLPFKNIFDHYLTTLIIDEKNEKCTDFFEDNKIGFEYNFIGTKKIKMSNSLFKDSEACFKGTILNYEFNPAIKKFNLINIE